ncbi:hypothetical protein Pint_15124 [Pistacia integerrima]|uniref:Uncharacterized protein n=1 Tax=Pistacia integerrima TaxID=434235 RepID=A0ACC0ZCL5_9ROSI|nr:hypothetical protein Pint_15124 [Pistacia integerrima]
MSSDFYDSDNSFYCQHSSPEMASFGAADPNFYTEPFSPFFDSSLDIFQAISNSNITSIINPNQPVDESSLMDQVAHTLLSSSPPSHLLENLSLCQSTHLQPFAKGYQDFSSLDAMEVKREESLVGFDSCCNQQQRSFVPHSHSGVENVAKYTQMSYRINSFDNKSGLHFQPRFDILMEPPNFHNQALRSPRTHKTQRSFSRHLATESPFSEEANFKVGRCSAEERQEKILKYRAKRNKRNFKKTIKYECRKTLADNRPRIRGRFVSNDENGEIPKLHVRVRPEMKAKTSSGFRALHEKEDHVTMREAAFVSSSGIMAALEIDGEAFSN